MFNAYTAKDGAAVTPSDGVDIPLPQIAQELYVGGAGNLTIVTEVGSTLTYVNVQAGTVLRMRTARIKATGTTATNIIAHY